MKNNFKTENYKIMRKPVIFAVIAVVTLVAVFYGIERVYIRNSAIETITKAMTDGESSDSELPAAYFIYTDEVNTGVLISSEERLAEYYLKRGSANKSVRLFTEGGYHIYYAAEPSEYGDRIIYSDVTFSVRMANITAVILCVIVAVFCVSLIFMGRRLANQLDRKDEGMKQFFANASHELKTPLMAIRGNIDGIRSGYVPTEKACGVIEKETDRMTALIGNILELSRLDSGSTAPVIVRVDLRETIYDACEIIQSPAREKGVEVRVEVDEPIFRECDEAMMFSAFSNILTNGIRYAQSEILISAERDNDSLRLFFRNDGAAITEDDMLHIFDRFYKGAEGQTGIGMSLAREYVRLNGGDIAVKVVDGKTVFEIKL